MKNIKYIIITFLIFSFHSCVEDPDTLTEHFIINNSMQEIRLYFYKVGDIQDSVYIESNEFKKYKYSFRGIIKRPPPFYSDSVTVAFNDTTIITHYNISNSIIQRNILLEASWAGGAIDDYIYRYEYVFTDADYEEALSY